MINEETIYRSGKDLVAFFNQLGFKDVYSSVFPSRKDYTYDKLNKINTTADMDLCIRNLFNPVNYVNNFNKIDIDINEFNKFLQFDGWKVIRNNYVITFEKVKVINIDEEINKEKEFTNNEFLRNIYDIDLDKLKIEERLKSIIKSRIDEIKICINAKAPLSVIFLSGSTLEGILLSYALLYPKKFNTAKSSPKNDKNVVKKFQEWSLANYIDVAYEIKLIKEDVKKFSHALREFRNYIHPYEQCNNNFAPDIHTAEICFKVLEVAIYQISEYDNTVNS